MFNRPMLPLIFAVLFLGAAHAARMDVWTQSAYVNVFRDDLKTADAADSIVMLAAKNEFEGQQILLRSDSDFTIQGVYFSDLANPNDTLKKSSLSFNYVDYHYLTQNSSNSSGSIIRTAPAWFPDDLSNDSIRTVAANTSQPIWIRTFIPKSTTPGSYSGLVTVRTTAGDFSVKMRVKVADAAIPDAKDGAFTTEFWFFPSFIKSKYGCESYSVKWWSIMDIWAQSFKDYRMNCVWVLYLDLLLDAGTTIDSAGVYNFNWSLFDKYVTTFIDKGGVKRLAGGHLGGRISDWNSDYGINVLKKVGNQMQVSMQPFGSTDVNQWLSQFLPALGQHLKDKGWYDYWYQHIADEPSTAQHTSFMGWVTDSIRKYCPGMKVGDAVFAPSTLTPLEGKVGFWTTKTDVYESNTAFFNAQKAAGDEVWFYTCCGPKGPLNRFIDYPVWNMRSLAWLCYKQQVTGFLHWGWNYWEFPVEQQTYCEGNSPGDGNTVYPDSARGTIKGSIRYEAFRDAAEEYELLTLLEKKDSAQAAAMAFSIARSGTDYERNVDLLLAKRNALIAAVSTYVPVPATIRISGPDVQRIPASGSYKTTYTAVIKDQYDVDITGRTVKWHLESPTTGIWVDSLAGSVSIDSTALPGTFTLAAVDSGVSGRLTVTLTSVYYQYSIDYSNTQGNNGWYYQYLKNSSYFDMTWSASNNCWQGDETYLLLSQGGFHPGNNSDAALKWVAPKSGQIRITGTVRKTNLNPAGNGIVATIRNGASTVWGPVTVGCCDSVGITHDLTLSVDSGNALYFIINNNGNNGADGSAWDPIITLDNTTPSAGQRALWAFEPLSVCPNPFNPSVTLRYALSRKSQVTLEIFNVRGKLVRTLVDSPQEAGPHLSVWNGRDNAGNTLTSGIYLVRLFGNGLLETRRVQLIK